MEKNIVLDKKERKKWFLEVIFSYYMFEDVVQWYSMCQNIYCFRYNLNIEIKIYFYDFLGRYGSVFLVCKRLIKDGCKCGVCLSNIES